MKNNNIIIQCRTGKELFKGDYKSPLVDKVLNANRCECEKDAEKCNKCGDTVYKGDFEIMWEDEERTDNVYEFINY